MKQFLINVAASFVAFCLVIGVGIVMLIGLAVGSTATAPQVEAPERIVLSLDLRQPLTDRAAVNPFAPSPVSPATSVVEIVRLLERAEEDDRVAGLYYRVGTSMPVAQASELREALASFRQSGKFAVAYAQSLFSPSLADYYMAAGADEIWMQPESFIFSSGVALSTPFLKGLLDGIGVEAENYAREEYKNAFHIFSETAYTDAHREAEQRLVDTIYEAMIGAVAADRGTTPEAMMALLDSVPYASEQAVERGLIDLLGYPVDAEEAVLDRAGEGAELVGLDRYSRILGPGLPEGREGDEIVALIHGDGAIFEGHAEDSFFGGTENFGGDTISQAILAAAEDEKVKAIVFRVNSPGGSAVASDQVLNALKRAQDAGKPVVVSMADVAASGGYWVSMSADRIVAHDTTVTGSIGVVWGKFSTGGLMEKIGVNVAELSRGERALFFSAISTFDEEEQAAVNKFLDQVYDGFTNRVAEGRDLSRDDVLEIAKGRVWSGLDAKRLNLVDEIGGLRTAVNEARTLAALPEETPLVTYPKPRPFVELLLEAFGGGGMARAMQAVDAVITRSGLRQILDLLRLEDEGVIAVEPARVD